MLGSEYTKKQLEKLGFRFVLNKARLGQDCILERTEKRIGGEIPFTWIVTQELLPESKLYDYELTWAYSKL